MHGVAGRSREPVNAGIGSSTGSAAMKAEAQLVEAVRSNRKQGRQCLEEGDARHAFSQVHSPSQLHIPLASNIGCSSFWPSATELM